MYQNAGSVGDALKKWKGGSRKDVYIVTKCQLGSPFAWVCEKLTDTVGQDGLKEEDWEPRKVLNEQLKLVSVTTSRPESSADDRSRWVLTTLIYVSNGAPWQETTVLLADPSRPHSQSSRESQYLPSL